MQRQLELIMQSIRTSIERDSPISSDSSLINHEDVYRTTFNCGTKSTNNLPRKHLMTSNHMQLFYNRGRHLRSTRHDSCGSTGSFQSTESTQSAGSTQSLRSDDNTNQAISCRRTDSLQNWSRDSTPDSARSRCDSNSSSRKSTRSWFGEKNYTTSPSLSSLNSSDENDVFDDDKRQDSRGSCVRLVFVYYCNS